MSSDLVVESICMTNPCLILLNCIQCIARAATGTCQPTKWWYCFPDMVVNQTARGFGPHPFNSCQPYQLPLQIRCWGGNQRPVRCFDIYLLVFARNPARSAIFDMNIYFCAAAVSSHTFHFIRARQIIGTNTITITIRIDSLHGTDDEWCALHRRCTYWVSGSRPIVVESTVPIAKRSMYTPAPHRQQIHLWQGFPT